MVLVKVALLLFYLRLDDRLLMRWAVHSLTVVVIGMGVGHFVMSVVECSPPEVFWTSRGDRMIYMQQCMTQSKQQAFWDAAGIIVIITDICLWICPIPMIWNLQLPEVSCLPSLLRYTHSHGISDKSGQSRPCLPWVSYQLLVSVE